MSAKLIDGKAIAARIRDEIRDDVRRLREETGITPGLTAVLVGDDPASLSYVRSKRKACLEIGMNSDVLELPAHTTQQELEAVVDRLNADRAVHGILIQLPLPNQIQEAPILERIDPRKDVDGFHPVNVGKLALGMETFVPCTPAGVVELLMRSGIDPSGKLAVIVGRSNIVGRPLAALLSRKGKGGDATVVICHSRTKDLAAETRRADILVAAMGKPGTIRADMVKPGAVVVDVGVNRVEDASSPKGYRLVGDVDFERVREVASAITPVPGGVGPMTIAMLLANTLKAARLQASVK